MFSIVTFIFRPPEFLGDEDGHGPIRIEVDAAGRSNVAQSAGNGTGWPASWAEVYARSQVPLDRACGLSRGVAFSTVERHYYGMFLKRIRRVALIGPIGDRRVSVHTGGFPLARDRMLPDADVVLLVGSDKEGVMLFRYSAHGELCGDTPHSSVAEAEHQVKLEYGEALFDWMDVPADVKDAHMFAVQYAADRLNQRGG
jgi:hypothetical protein